MTNEEAINELKYAQAMCAFDPSTGEVCFRNEEARKQYEALGVAIKALEEKPEIKRKYKKIYLCGDCGFYNWKKHKCGRGATDVGSATDKFYKDCPLPSGGEAEP